MLPGTPFHPRTSALCEAQNWRRWAGYIVASSYELAHEREYFAVRNSAALIDVSPLFKYEISGLDAERLLNRVVTRDVAACNVGQVLYTPWCDEDGKVIDDGTLQRLDDHTFRLTAADPNLRWLYQNVFGMDVELRDVSEDIAALALQGPNSRAILQAVSDADLDGLRYFRLTPAHVGEIPVTISRTGFTGDLGYEIWVAAEDAVALWDALIEAGTPHGITPAGMLALDMVRIEAGLLNYGADMTLDNNAYEVGLGWLVDLDQEADFIGKEALTRIAAEGVTRKLVGVEIAGDRIEFNMTKWPVSDGGRQIGEITSAIYSPRLEKNIGYAMVPVEYAGLGTEFTVSIPDVGEQPVTVVRKPFVDPEKDIPKS